MLIKHNKLKKLPKFNYELNKHLPIHQLCINDNDLEKSQFAINMLCEYIRYCYYDTYHWHNKNHLQKSCKVLVENKLKDQEKYFGRTECMTPVIFDSNCCLPGEIVDVEIISYNRTNLFGLHNTNKIEAA